MVTAKSGRPIQVCEFKRHLLAMDRPKSARGFQAYRYMNAGAPPNADFRSDCKIALLRA